MATFGAFWKLISLQLNCLSYTHKTVSLTLACKTCYCITVCQNRWETFAWLSPSLKAGGRHEDTPLWIRHCGYATVAHKADFGRDPRSSDSLRGSRNFFGQVNDARFHPFPVGNISRNLNRTTSINIKVKNFETEFWKNFTVRGRFLKTHKLFNKFPDLATSCLHNSATITDRPKLTTKIVLYALVSIFKN